MKLFRKKRDKATAADNSRDKVAGIIAKGIVRAQSKWASWMQRQSERLSYKAKKAVLILCCFVTAGYSAFVIINGISGNHKIDLHVTPMQRPVDVQSIPAAKPDLPELKNIRKYLHYMDSLTKDATGRRTFDSIIKARPGLMDSSKYAEKIYQSQSKN